MNRYKYQAFNIKHNFPSNYSKKFVLRMTNILIILFAFLLFWSLVPILHAEILYHNNFDNSSLGQYTRSDIVQDWQTGPFSQVTAFSGGIDKGYAQIIEGSQAFDGKSLQMKYPQGGVGYHNSGTSWSAYFSQPHDELYVSYRIKFGDNFDWVYGGKIPGFAGGTEAGGGIPSTGYNGWSARMMWDRSGILEFYLYYADMDPPYGDAMWWDITLDPGRWYHFEHRIKMNTAGGDKASTPYDGILQGWCDGVLVYNKQDVRYRYVDSFAIDALRWDNFYGGTGSEFAPPKDNYVYFDDVTISTTRVGLDITYQCSDGIDNDGDGLTDLNDPGCSSTTDNDEYNPPLPEPPAGAIEAESGTLSSPMQIVSDSGASGGAYIQTTTPESGTVTYSFHIDTPGTYKIISRVYAPSSNGDSFFVKIDNQEEGIWDLNPSEISNEFNVWREDEVTKRGTGTYDNPQYDPYIIVLTQGMYTITFRGRETNSRLDYFYFLRTGEPPILQAPKNLEIIQR